MISTDHLYISALVYVTALRGLLWSQCNLIFMTDLKNPYKT